MKSEAKYLTSFMACDFSMKKNESGMQTKQVDFTQACFM